MENNKYKELYKKLGYTFKNEEVIETALRHPSMCYSRNQKCDNYERLELLGDSVLSLIILDMLLKYYKNLNEGEIAKRKSNLVCSETLSKIAKNMGLGEYIIMTKGEEKLNGRNNQHILEDIVESIIGGIYIEGGINEATKFVERYWTDLFKEQIDIEKFSKSSLQEWLQKQQYNITEYFLVKEEGSDSEPIFTMKILVNNFPEFIETGKTKKETEKKLASKMIEYIKNNKDPNI